MKLKRCIALLLAVVLCIGVFSACGGSSDAAYTVKVTDAQGNASAGVIVKFLQNGAQVAMQPVNAQGVAEKTLAKGDYTVELVFTGDNTGGYYDQDAAVLTKDKTSLEITLYNSVSGEGTDLFAPSLTGEEGKTHKAHNVTVGSTYIQVEAGERNYFLFTPTQAGTYQVTVDNSALKLGYYGSPYFVQKESVVEIVDNAFTISISASMIGSGSTGSVCLVIGVDGIAEKTGCVLSVVRTGDPQHGIEDEPWTLYQTTHTPAPFSLTLAAGEELTYVDIKGTTQANQVVYNAADGFYHFGTADGPVVYVHLGKKAPNVSLQTMIQGDGPVGGAPLRKYFYDNDGKFIKKEDYTDIMTGYFANMDQNLGIYPLNSDLVYILQNGCSGWWDATSPDYIFEGCNPEIGWMFALCYVG